MGAQGWKPTDDDEAPLPSDKDGWVELPSVTPRSVLQGPQGENPGVLRKAAVGAIASLQAVQNVDGVRVARATLQLTDMHRTLGVAVSTVTTAGQQVTVVSAGEVSSDGWRWTPDKPVFLGPGGVLTQTVDPSWPFIRVMGIALSATKIYVNLRPPVILTP